MELRSLRVCLEALAANADILPASGGAAQQLLQPDQEEREDAALAGEGISDLFGETPAPRTPDTYIPCPPVPRTENHRFRYFLDGSMRSYFLCSVSEHNVTEPLLLSEIGSAVMQRLDNGDLRPLSVRRKLILLLQKKPFSDALNVALDAAAQQAGIQVVDTSVENEYTRRTAADSAAKAQGCARWEMRLQERDMLAQVPVADSWLVVDGSIGSRGSRQAILPGQKVLGVAKSFAKSPKFRTGRTAQPMTVTRMVARLPVHHRSPLFVSSQGDTAFWYVRLWEQGAVDFPLMGVVKCDMILPADGQVVPSEIATEISSSLTAERSVTPYGRDARWHSHLYPIYIAERVIRTRFLSPMILRERIGRDWATILRRMP